MEVRRTNLGCLVEDCIDQRDPNDLGFGARRDGTEHSRLAVRELLIDGSPQFPRPRIEGKPAALSGNINAQSNLSCQVFELATRDIAPEWQHF